MECAHCHQPFQPRREWQKFCSQRCRFDSRNMERRSRGEKAQALLELAAQEAVRFMETGTVDREAFERLLATLASEV